jgi:RNA polymerase sigma-70 factor (ECF subfamily)
MAAVTALMPRTSTDDQLLDRLARGDRAALDALFERYRQPAFRVAYRLLGNEADALDAVQDGFVKVLTHLRGFQGRSSFKTWLMRVVSNAALDLGRQRGRRQMRSLSVPLSRQLEEESLATTEDPASGMERSDVRQVLDQALASLSETHRVTFVLHADAGLSYREVADTLKISIGTVMSRLYYARQKLRLFVNQRLNHEPPPHG